MPNAGYPETRQAVADGLSAETGLPFGAGDIVMTCGAAGAANVVLRAILNPGDEVIILAPFFGEYVYYIRNHNGAPVIVPTNAQFGLDLGAIDAAVTERTRAIILNSPNNPSGVVYPAADIAALADLLAQAERRHSSEIFIISDEPYRRIIYDGLTYPPVFPHYARAIVVNSHAKDLGLPGERIGHIAVHPDYAGKAELVGRPGVLQPGAGLRQRPGADAACGARRPGRVGGCGRIPAQARFSVRPADRNGLPDCQTAGGVLPVPPIAAGR